MSNQASVKVVTSYQVSKDDKVVAITTPVPGKDGQVSRKTPIFHLPVYKIDLEFDHSETLTINCDLADMIDLISKLKTFENIWRRSG